MEPVGATASILTFVTVAFSATKSIYGTLSAIKDGPEVLGSINDEISQLQNILQRLLQVVTSTARPTDRSKLEQMVKKCRDDLVGFESKLRQFDVSGADGPRGQLWRKLKLCFGEKDLDRIRHVVGRHVQLLTLYLSTIQDQQSSLIAAQSTDILARIASLQRSSSTTTQSTEILDRIECLQQISPTATQLNEVLVSLQQLQQDMAVLQLSCASVQTQTGASGIASRVVELDDKNSPISQQTALDEAIARLMRLVEKKPSTMEFGDAQEIFADLERLLQSVGDDAHSSKARQGDQNKDADVSNEMKLFTGLIFSAQTLRVNQTQPINSLNATEPRFCILQQRTRKNMETEDNLLTVTTTKRQRKVLPVSQNASESEVGGWGFLGTLTVKSKTKKKMITLSVNRSQLLFNRFTSMLPRVIVSQILPNDSHVFQVASYGSVQDLMRLIVENKASLHDHDEDGWSLLHHSVGNLPMLRFLIEEGLDVDEVAQVQSQNHSGLMTPLNIAFNYRHDISFSEVLLCAGADPTISLDDLPTLDETLAFASDIEARNILYRVFCISPFMLSDPPDDPCGFIYFFCQAWARSSAEDFNPEQEQQTLDLLIGRGYSLHTSDGRQSGLHGFFSSKKQSFSRALERRDLLVYLISRGTDPCMADRWGVTPSYLAYGSMCMPCSMSQSSLMGDLWDSVLDICGYDISKFRRDYPRKASYKNGYSREIFEELWRGREERCPYWNDDPWPEFSDEAAEFTFEYTLGHGLCARCRFCFDSAHGNHAYDSCGICLLVFHYSCTEEFDVDHIHNRHCPRSRVGYFERSENDGQYFFRTKSCSDLDSDNQESDYYNTSSSSDEFEDAQSPTDQAVIKHPGYGSEEITSDDESVGGVSI